MQRPVASVANPDLAQQASSRLPLQPSSHGWSGLAFIGLIAVAIASGATAAQAQVQHRYDKAVFACISIDPTGTPLNLRRSPHGTIVGTVSGQQVVYVRGRNLRLPEQGYVPVYLQGAALHAPATVGAGHAGAAPPTGWVWKAFITCELSS
jgi:hypothetical protein